MSWLENIGVAKRAISTANSTPNDPGRVAVILRSIVVSLSFTK